MKVKTPANGMARAFGNVASGSADAPEIAHCPAEIQIRNLRRQFNLSPAVAAATAALLYPQVDSWRAGR